MSKKFTHKSLSLIINLDKCTVNIWGGEAVPVDFNKILLGKISLGPCILSYSIDFLELDPDKPFLVKQALGFDLMEFKQQVR